jgi:hypothetical protein
LSDERPFVTRRFWPEELDGKIGIDIRPLGLFPKVEELALQDAFVKVVHDKSSWADGPWVAEPDELTWVYKEYRCLAWRHPEHGTLNGYVQVPEDHPCHGMDFDDRIEMMRNDVEDPENCPPFISILLEAFDPKARDGTVPISIAIPVHGGITFAGEIPDRDGWWFGFDTNHCDDMLCVPKGDIISRLAPSLHRGIYRELPYVVSQVHAMADAFEKLK